MARTTWLVGEEAASGLEGERESKVEHDGKVENVGEEVEHSEVE